MRYWYTCIAGTLFEFSRAISHHHALCDKVTSKNRLTLLVNCFSDNWSRQREQHPFIDQDSDAFVVLLSYMRCGFVKVELLTDLVCFKQSISE